MYNKVLLDIYVRSVLYAYTSKELSIFCTRYSCCCLGAAASLMLLLLSTVMCACTVIISLVVVISRHFESQLKSSGHATHSHSF